MGNCWQIRQSRYSTYLILILVSIPLLTSLLLKLSWIAHLGTVILLPLFYYLLIKNISIPGACTESTLSWQNGKWMFSNDVLHICGFKENCSFSLGKLMHLSIKDNNNDSINIWLFPDNFNKEAQEWRQLHSCFYLSDYINK